MPLRHVTGAGGRRWYCGGFRTSREITLSNPGRRQPELEVNPQEASLWPYLPTLEKLGLALALGLFVGLERERRGKEAGLRTFGFAALIGAIGGLLGGSFAVVALIAVLLLAVLLNVQSLRAEQGAELTTSAALVLTSFAGLLAGMGHRLVPSAIGVVTAALLAWKDRLTGFSKALSEAEVRSAILLAILGFVVLPALPEGHLDRWQLIDPRAAWITVLLIAGIGFVNYILLKVYGARGVELTGFLGGLVNSTVTVTELASKDRESSGALRDMTYRGVVLATTAMTLRNAVLLGILAPRALAAAAIPLFLMLLVGIGLVLIRRRAPAGEAAPALPLSSPFSIQSALRFGVIFLVLEVGGTLAQRGLGGAGFLAVTFIGGLVSSASAVASAAMLAASGKTSPELAGIGAILAALASTLVNLPLVARVSKDSTLTRRLALPIAAVTVAGIGGSILQFYLGKFITL
jgi:uncharacterized membrane protein (DUF4010 family)